MCHHKQLHDRHDDHKTTKLQSTKSLAKIANIIAVPHGWTDLRLSEALFWSP